LPRLLRKPRHQAAISPLQLTLDAKSRRLHGPVQQEFTIKYIDLGAIEIVAADFISQQVDKHQMTIIAYCLLI
jgi:hypothetical protein